MAPCCSNNVEAIILIGILNFGWGMGEVSDLIIFYRGVPANNWSTDDLFSLRSTVLSQLQDSFQNSCTILHLKFKKLTHYQVALILHPLKNFTNLWPPKCYCHTARYFLFSCMCSVFCSVFYLIYMCILKFSGCISCMSM